MEGRRRSRRRSRHRSQFGIGIRKNESPYRRYGTTRQRVTFGGSCDQRRHLVRSRIVTRARVMKSVETARAEKPRPTGRPHKRRAPVGVSTSHPPMNKDTLTVMFARVDSWNVQENRQARDAFISEVCGRGKAYQYSYDAALQAWGWFLQGWTMGTIADH